mgnify:FL=1
MKISCDVIRDLLPLYVEDMLSNDSKNIVDEHIEQCENCSEELKKLSVDETYINTVNNENKSIYDSLNKIRKRISFKIQITVLISVIFTAIVAVGAWDYYDNHRIYMPYKEAKIKWVKDSMQTSEKYRDVNQVISTDGKSLIIVLNRTHRTSNDSSYSDRVIWKGPNREYSYEDKNGEEKLANIEEVYYMSSDAWERYKEREVLIYNIPQDEFNLEKYKREFNVVKRKSKLIWTKSNGFIG